MLSIAQIAKTKIVVHRQRVAHSGTRQLWSEAAKLARGPGTADIDQELIESHVSIDEVYAAVRNKLDECTQKRWRYTKANGEKVVLWDLLDKITKWIDKFKAVGDVAVQYDPGHAALPWAVIRFMLQATVSSVETFGHMLEGIELSSRITAIYVEVERACLKGVSRLKTQLADALVKMYAGVLSFLSKAMHYFGQSSTKRALKGAFQSYRTSVAPFIDRIDNAEKDVLKLVGLVQSEDQKNLLVMTRRAVLDIKESRTTLKVPKDERRRLVRGWLEAVSTTDTFQKAQMVRHEKTCCWIFDRPEFLEWETTTNDILKPKILWLHSGPGFGKTILCAKIIDQMVEHDVRLVYFFCVADEERKRQPYAILRSWIDQLTQANEDALDIAYEMYKSIDTREPTTTELWRLFKTLARAIACTFVIDGFDECSTINKHAQRHTTDGRSEFLERLIKAAMDTQARVLILSRDHEDIRVQLGTLNRATTPMLLEYGISVNDTKGDIEHCSLDMINTRLANKPSGLRANLASEAAEKSDGMFLWLHLLSREIDPGENSKRLRNIVSEMPAGINETYERDLEKVQNLKSPQKVRAIAILRWILFALRPLTVRELAEVIAATVDESADSYPHDDLPDSWREGYVDEQYVNSYIRRSCGSLVELRGHNENKPLALHTVHFVHFSVKEYLLRSDDLKSGQSRLERICFPDGGKENDRLARLCLQYLCYDVFGEEKHFQAEKRIQVYPFLAYAAKSWYMHALRDQPMSDDIMLWAEKLFNPSTSNWILWSKVFEGELQLDDELSSPSLRDEDPTVAEDTDGDDESALYLTGDETSSSSAGDAEELNELHNLPSPIYYASLLGLTDIVKALQAQGLGCSAPGGLYGFPLQAAVHNSRQETVEYLLQQGIDVNQRGGLYGLAICAAAAQGVHKILDLLIKAGADLTGEDKDGRNCLHFAGKQGARATVKALLEAGLDPMHKSRLGKTPFYEAVESGDLETVSLMLDAGADANDMSKGGIPVVLKAVFLGYQEMVGLLLDRHADINLPSSSGLSSLHEAVIMDHKAILDMLLANSADVHAQEEDGWTALCFAVAHNNIAAAELLISRGANINTSANEGWTPLHIAAEQADAKIMAILLRHGAAVDAENSTSRTSLFEAVCVGNVRGVELLLTYGASVSKINNRGDTVLDDAIQSSDKNIIECLLDNHALSDLSDKSKGTNELPIDVQRSNVATEISKAIFRGDEDMASQLIGSSDSTISQNDLDIALLSCSVFNAPSLAEGLLRGGASLSATTHNKRTPLHFAARNDSLQLTKLFLDHGANIDAVDYSGYTPLDLTIGNGLASIDIVTYLVENGALVSQRSDRKEDTTVRAKIDSTLDGHWVGTYTYNSWQKGRVDPTALTIRFDTSSLNSKHPLWKCTDHDLAGRFEVLGHVFTNNTIRFVKLYESQGWLYLGVLDRDTMVIRGTWGSSMTLRHGSFEMKKVEQ